MLLTLLLAGSLDFKAMLGAPASTLAARWGEPVRFETRAWKGEIESLPTFGEATKWAMAPPSAGWTSCVERYWEDVPALMNDHIKDVLATYSDGHMTMLGLHSEVAGGPISSIPAFFASYGLAVPSSIEFGSDITRVTQNGIDWRLRIDMMGTGRDNAPRPSLQITAVIEAHLFPIDPPETPTCDVDVDSRGVVSSVVYEGLPLDGDQVATLARIKVQTTGLRALKKGRPTFVLASLPGWIENWERDANGKTCSISFYHEGSESRPWGIYCAGA